MNKYQDALSRMYDNLDYASYYYLDDKCDDDYDILCELIDKATPKKPVPYTPRNVERYYCGKCDLRLKKSWIICPRCATYILWDAQEIANLFYFKEQMKKQMRGKKDEN